MGIYDSGARRNRVQDVAVMVADSPTSVTITREGFVDPMRGSHSTFIGPYLLRIEPFRTSRNPFGFEEKGDVSSSPFAAIGTLIPQYQDVDRQVPTFALADTLTAEDGTVYHLTSPATWDKGVVSFNIEMDG